jgi:peroxiredoxin Q/BCP
MLHVGDKAPDFLLRSGDGQQISLKGLRGKRIILYFYPKDQTSGYTKEACSFQEHLKVFRKKGAVVIGVSADSVESHVKFAEKNNLKFLLLSDETKEVLAAYGVWKKKSMYGRTYFGIERTTFLIDEAGVIRNIFEKVKVNGHTEEILAAL